MKIHDSYSKKDLVKVIQDFNIPDIDLKLTRYDIVKILYNFWDDYDLSFLENENPVKTLSIKEKNDIIIKAKKIIALHKNGYNIDRSLYNNIQEVIDDAEFISQYGDISSVRRAINFVNEKYDKNIICTLTDETKDLLDQKEEIKKSSNIGFNFKRGTFKIDFT
tara:strand:- start:829 stop:1320 length:492 start_codon:yes stop_codon:yes gene_type:complete